MKFNFTDYLNTRLDEKLGNLNASNDPKYAFLLKAALKNKDLRGLAGPNSKIVTLTGKGRSQFVKDLRDIQKKMGDPQLVFLTTEYKVTMIKNDDDGKWDDCSRSWVSTPISVNLKTIDIFIGNVGTWDARFGPNLPKVDVEGAITSAKGNLIYRRLKNSLDRASLDDDTEYHAVVILPDPENLSKDEQRTTNLYRGSGDKYAVIRNGNTRFMDQAKHDAEALRMERSAKSYNLRTMTFEDLYDILGNSNNHVVIDNDSYTKVFYDKISGHGYKFTVTSSGIINICNLYDQNKKLRMLTYNTNRQQFVIE